MIDLGVFGDWPYKEFISKTMRVHQLLPIPEHAVSKRNVGCGPYPAVFRPVHFRPESGFRGLGRSGKSALGVVFHTVIIPDNGQGGV